jgi:hypothetical protein
MLKILRIVAIIVFMVVILFIWTAVPEDELNELEEEYASKQSK